MKAGGTQDESMLVLAARQGDKAALQMLLEHNWAWLRGLVYGVLGDARDLDDVMQEVCVRVITRVHTLREPSRFRAWLGVLVRREAIKHRQRTRFPATARDGAQTAAPPEGYLNDPADEVEKKELCSRVLEAVRRLPEKYREVFVLAHTGELTYAQMAEVLDIPITTMQIRLVRARQMIRDQVAGPSERRVRENECCG